MIGTNLGHGERPDVSALREAGVRAVRFVLEPHRDDTDYIIACQNEEVDVLGVLARESFRDEPRRPHLDHYWRRYGRFVWRWQCGNEPDLDSPSSWTMSPSALLALTYEVRDAMPDATLVAAGLASGQPGWLWACRDILSLVDYVAVHPYGRTPDDSWGTFSSGGWGFGPVGPFVDAYAQYGKPIIVSEYGCPDRELSGRQLRRTYHSSYEEWIRRVRDPNYRVPPGPPAIPRGSRYADYIGGMTAAVRDHPAVEAAHQFAWSDAVPGFGLHRADGSRKPAFDRFREEALKQEVPVPDGDQFNIGAGFREAINRHGLTPLGPERYFTDDMSLCPTDRYLLWYCKPTNEIRMQPWGPA